MCEPSRKTLEAYLTYTVSLPEFSVGVYKSTLSLTKLFSRNYYMIEDHYGSNQSSRIWILWIPFHKLKILTVCHAKIGWDHKCLQFLIHVNQMKTWMLYCSFLSFVLFFLIFLAGIWTLFSSYFFKWPVPVII